MFFGRRRFHLHLVPDQPNAYKITKPGTFTLICHENAPGNTSRVKMPLLILTAT